MTGSLGKRQTLGGVIMLNGTHPCPSLTFFSLVDIESRTTVWYLRSAWQ